MDQKTIVDAFTIMAPDYENLVDKELSAFWGWRYQDFMNLVVGMSEIYEKDRVLDIATGTAVIPFTIYNLNPDSGSIHGLDITLSMLLKAKQKLSTANSQINLELTCASGVHLPYRSGSFDFVICGLATHHMEVSGLLAEIARVTRPKGRITLADVGGVPLWKWPVINTLIRAAAFIYFLPGHGFARAWSEGAALSNVRTAQEWGELLKAYDFTGIKITKLQTAHFWSPDALVLQAQKL